MLLACLHEIVLLIGLISRDGSWKSCLFFSLRWDCILQINPLNLNFYLVDLWIITLEPLIFLLIIKSTGYIQEHLRIGQMSLSNIIKIYLAFHRNYVLLSRYYVGLLPMEGNIVFAQLATKMQNFFYIPCIEGLLLLMICLNPILGCLRVFGWEGLWKKRCIVYCNNLRYPVGRLSPLFWLPDKIF